MPMDIVIIGVIAAIVGGAAYAIYRSTKAGKKCIGCPDSGTCGSCSGGCSCGCGK